MTIDHKICGHTHTHTHVVSNAAVLTNAAMIHMHRFFC